MIYVKSYSESIKKLLPIVSKLPPPPTIIFNVDFQKIDQHTAGKWLIHGIKQRKNNHMQSLLIDYLNMTQRNPKVTCSFKYSKECPGVQAFMEVRRTRTT